MRMRQGVIAALLVLAAGTAAAGPAALEVWRAGGTRGEALVCRPDGAGPWPAVLFNHGLVVDLEGLAGAAARGYDLAGVCAAFAAAGYLGFLPIRTSGPGNIPGHYAEVAAALDALRSRADVDPARIALAGFSRGGLLALMVAVRRSDYRAVVLFAPAPGRGRLRRAAAAADRIAAPVLVMVAADDREVILEDVAVIEGALRAAGRPARVIRYRAGGGHRLFWRKGDYWPDLVAFLDRHMKR